MAEGRGLTTVWVGDGPKKTFEWQKNSMFLLPRGSTSQLSNVQGSSPRACCTQPPAHGDAPVCPTRSSTSTIPTRIPTLLYGEGAEFYSEAKAIAPPPGSRADRMRRVIWLGNFFPDMGVWDKLHTYEERGAGGHRVGVQFAKSTLWSHMSVFPPAPTRRGIATGRAS